MIKLITSNFLAKILSISFLSVLFCANIQAQVSGKVFRDFNANGIQTTAAPDPIEPGLKDVTVNAYDVSGALNTATTDATGTYSIAGGTGPYRVEFILPTYYYASNGSVANTTVQFVAAGATGNLGVNYPADYCQANPAVSVPILVFGSNTQFPNEATLISNPFTARNGNINTPPPIPNDKTLAKVSDIGSVYGSAYNRETKDIFVSAFLKRYAGFGLGNGGADGSAGAIYKITSSGAISVLLDLPASEIGTNPHPNTTTDFLKDPMWWQVGKMGWGDIDMSDDGTKLYAMNLFNRKLYEINASSGAVLNTYPIPGITGGPSFTGPTADNDTDLRPFGVKFYQGNVYVGVVCTAESDFANFQWTGKSTNYKGFIFKFTPGTGYNTTPVLDFQMAGDKATYSYLDGIGSYDFGYPIWMSESHFTANVNDWNDYRMSWARAVISDIDFINGDMVIGIRDLSKDLFPARAGTFAPDGTTALNQSLGSAGSMGRLLRACTSNNTTFSIENNGACGGVTGYNNKTYYRQFLTHASGDLMGGIGVLPTEQMIISNAQPGANTEAVAFLDEAGKAFDDTDQLNVVGNVDFGATQDPNTPYGNPLFGKANGLGDIEVLCNPQPLEIGNRVFMDTDADGIQDADEMGIDGVKVELWKAGAKVTEVTTANGGQYIFTNVDAKTNYEIKILAANIPSGKSLTTKDATSTGLADVADSDASLVGADAVITYTTGSGGENNHTLDFGFKPATCTTPTAGTNTPAAGTCNGTTPNDDAKIDFAGITNADKAEKSEGATYMGAAYSAATGTVTGGAVSFTGLKHNTDYTFRIWNAADACFLDVTIKTPTKTCAAVCTTPTAGTNTPAAGTCNGTTPNDDAKIDFAGITNADKAEKSEGATYTGAAYSAATGTVTGGAVSFTGLKHNTDYTFRIWNAADACFLDVTVKTPTKSCAAVCTTPTAGTNTPAAGTCNGTTPNNDAKIDFAGITNADKAEKSEGATYTGAAYSAATGTVTGGAVSFTGLKHNTDYTFRIWNAADACFLDVTVKTPTKNCVPSGQTCSCSDFLYLNDPQNATNGFVHKFKVAANGTLTEQASGISGTNPWFPVGGGLPDPHGLGQDLNGNLYIGETNSGKVRKLSCDGKLYPTTAYEINDGGFNFNSYNGVLYINSKNSNQIRSYDLCSGTQLGYVELGSFVGDDWGFHISADGTFYITNSSFGGGTENIYRFKPTTSDFTAHTIYAPFITNTAYPASGQIGATWGITSDPQGNFYVVFEDNDQGDNNTYDTYIAKFDATGAFVAKYQEPWTFDNVGIEKGRGLVYYEPTKTLYIGAGPNGDCVAMVDAATMTYKGAAVGNVPGQNPKGIALGRECCSLAANLLIDTTMCTAKVGDKIFLQNLIGSCDGPVCGGEWTAGGTNNGVTLNTCDGSVSINDLAGCGTFSLSGGGGNSQCPLFNIEIKVDFGAKNTITLSSNQTICEGSVPNTLTATSSLPDVTYQWQQSTTSCTAGFTDIASATTASYTPSALSATTYYKVITTKAGGCNYGNCKDTSACITITVTPKPTAGTNTPTAGTCNGATPNDDAKIDFAGITNADKAEKSEGATYTGVAYSAATGTVTGGAVTFTGLKHNTQYTFRIWNGIDGCFIDVTVTTPTKMCSATCTQPTAGTNTPTAGTCNGTIPFDDAKVDFIGITNGDKAGKSEGATYTGADYTSATGTVSLGDISFTGLKHNTQYTFRIWNAADACFVDVTVTTPTKTCGTPCPTKVCSPVLVTRH
jgi:hypothetical protein